MNRLLPALSKGMLILGGFLILAGLGWGIWARVNAPPPPVISDEGAVVLAITAPAQPTSPPIRSAFGTDTEFRQTSAPSQPAGAEGSPPELLPEWPVTPPPSDPAPANSPSDPVPPAPTPTPTATRPPSAEDPPTRIVAPAIDLDSRVESMGWERIEYKGTWYTKWVVPKKAAGWHVNSSLPGHQENVVLSGHHNVEGKVFRDVVNLSMGDELTLYVGDTPYVYTVTEMYILKEAGMPLSVRKKNAQWIMPTGDERLTLVTCWPYEWPGNTHRVIVVARPPNHTDTREQLPK